MLKRLWLLISAVWFAVFVSNYLTRTPPSVGADDLLIACLPLLAGVALWRALRFVFFGR